MRFLNSLFGISNSKAPSLNSFDNIFDGLGSLLDIDIDTSLQNRQLGLSQLNVNNKEFMNIFETRQLDVLDNNELELMNNILDSREIKDLDDLENVFINTNREII